MTHRGLLALSVTAAVLAFGRDSDACGNAVERHLTPVEQMMTAEAELANGKIAQAAFRVRAQYPKIRALDASAPPLALRAERIYALAIVRANGNLDLHAAQQDEWARWGNLEWAITTLADLDAKRPNDPSLEADLAEARTRLARTRGDGLRVLEELDRRDLLGSPWAYLALARARDAQGDTGGRVAALKRCATMSTDATRCVTDVVGEAADPRG